LRQQNEIDLLIKGGNQRFKTFLNEYQIPKNEKFDYKYIIKASDYYRKMIKSELKNEDFIEEKPNFIEGLKIINSTSNKDLSKLIFLNYLCIFVYFTLKAIDNTNIICSNNRGEDCEQDLTHHGILEKLFGQCLICIEKIRNKYFCVITKICNPEIKQKLYDKGVVLLEILKNVS